MRENDICIQLVNDKDGQLERGKVRYGALSISMRSFSPSVVPNFHDWCYMVGLRAPPPNVILYCKCISKLSQHKGYFSLRIILMSFLYLPTNLRYSKCSQMEMEVRIAVRNK
jgi:hypothetical protein